MTTQKTTTQATTTQAATEQKEYLISGTRVTDKTKVKYVANPKRKGSASFERYEKYQTAKTWAEYRKLNDGKFQMADARHDLGKGFLEIVSSS